MNFGLGYSEIALIAVVALIILGPRRLPELMRTVGKVMGQLRRTSDELRREILFSDEINSVRQTIRDTIDPTTPPVPPRLKVKKPTPPAEEDQSSPDSGGQGDETDDR